MNLNFDIGGLKSSAEMWLPLILTLFSFVIYWFISVSGRVKDFFYARYNHDKASASHISFNRLAGFILMGVVPLAVCLLIIPKYSLADYGLRFDAGNFPASLFWILGIATVIVPVTILNAGKPTNLLIYPQIRTISWTRNIILINAFTWALYLLGYEILFRGVLLVPLYNYLGLWPAVAINVAVYSLAHLPKGVSETVGGAFLGLALSLLTIASGTIWIAFFVHLIMALTNSFASFYYTREMLYVSGTSLRK